MRAFAAGLVLAVCASSSALALPPVERQGSDLVAGGERFQAWGFNYGVGERYPILRYFERPSERRLRRVVGDMREARSLGSNCLRVYLEIGTFMDGPREPRKRALDALAELTDQAERLHLYLDITGNLVWRSPPPWYDALPEHARWAVQARFWRAVARAVGDSPAVLVYELTSEPAIGDSDHWYGGEFGGYTFVQRIVRQTAGRDPSLLARRWIRRLTRAIRANDRRHLIGLGMLPASRGSFGAWNVAGLLDVLLIHEYPEEGGLGEAIETVRAFAAEGKPVVVGETAPLYSSPATWVRFLRRARPYADGCLSFYDGRLPGEVGTTQADAWYAATLDAFTKERP